MKVNYKKIKQHRYAVYDIESGKVLCTNIDGMTVQLVYTTEKKAKDATDYINAHQ